MGILSLIVAMDENGLIGRDNGLPWRLPSDLAHFKKTTMGKPVVMGRNTYESIGKPLPGRENFILSRRANYQAPGCKVVGDFDEVINICRAADEIMVMGGAQIYEQVLGVVDRLYITRVHAHCTGDAWFPEIDWQRWNLIEETHVSADEKNEFPHSFECWEKCVGP